LGDRKKKKGSHVIEIRWMKEKERREKKTKKEDE